MRNTVALITGAPTGIGRTAAIIFAQEGANIVYPGVKTNKDKSWLPSWCNISYPLQVKARTSS